MAAGPAFRKAKLGADFSNVFPGVGIPTAEPGPTGISLLQHPGLRRSHKVSRDGSISLARQLHGQVWGNGAEARRFANVAAGLLHRGRVPAYALPSVSLSSSIARTGR
jgi:hypothetical protein